MSSKISKVENGRLERSKFRTNYNHQAQPDSYTEGPSMTQPDQAMSVSEIMARHRRGLPLPQSRQMFYGGDSDYPNLSAMDKTEKVDAQRNLQAYADNKQKELDELNKKRADRKKQIAAQKSAATAAASQPTTPVSGTEKTNEENK